jgi:RNA polymerase sigma factor (sigma-70 family)
VTPPFQSLLDRHGAALLGYLRAAVGPREAEDCFQDTVCAALRSYGRSTPTGADLRPWLFTVAHGVVVDHHRRRARRARPAPHRETAAVAPPMPHDEELWQALDRLPPKQRSATVLRVLEDLAYREVAAIMQISESAARRNVHVALGRLREELDHHDRSRSPT